MSRKGPDAGRSEGVDGGDRADREHDGERGDGVRERIVTLRHTGAGLIAGAVLLVALAGGLGLLPELAALLVAAAGLAATAIEHRYDRFRGVSIGLAGAALFLLLDRELDPVGATVARSVAATAAIGTAVLVGALLVEADVLDRFGGR